jgi:hypothetical protein
MYVRPAFQNADSDISNPHFFPESSSLIKSFDLSHHPAVGVSRAGYREEMGL